MTALLALVLAAAPALARDYPQAKLVQDGDHVVQATNFAAPAGGGSPAVAAERFVRRYADDFGVGPEQKLSAAGSTAGGRVRLVRSIRGVPVEGADLVVGLDGRGHVVLVNASRIPPAATGRFVLAPKAAKARARAALERGRVEQSSAAKAWYPVAERTRPAWRVDLATTQPAGSWRVWIDAEDGSVLFREDRRRTLRR